MSLLEWLGFLTGVLCVLLIVLERDVSWPIGVVNSVLLAWVFWGYALYAQAGLQVFYVIECLYGWYMWTRRDPASGLKLIRIGRTPRETFVVLGALTALGTAACFELFRRSSDPAPFWDSLVSIGSLAAEYLLCVKLLEGWALYFALDLVSLVLLAYLGQWVTFGTYLAFTGLCVMGVWEWSRRFRRASAAVQPA